MKLFRVNLLFILLAFGGVMAPQAQTFTTLQSFGVLSNKVGTVVRSPLVQGPDGTLYGVTSAGGGIVRGAVFGMGTNGSNFVILKQFTNVLEGTFPKSSLLLAGTTLYGTTSAGGSEDGGTIFRVNTDGTGFAVLKHLPAGSYNRNLPAPSPSGGGWHEPNPPMGGLALAGTTLYGTTRSGGIAARGNVFKLETDGSGYAVIKEFSGADGAAPTGDLVVSGSTLYGTTVFGGTSNTGTVFRVNVDGTGFATLKHFTGPDGAGPYAGLIISANTLYGVTVRGGASNSQAGTVFKINTDGSGFAVLKSFHAIGFPPQGVGPMGRLLLSGNVLYGTAATVLSGTGFIPTIFRVNTDGTGFSVVMTGDGRPTNAPIFTSHAGLVLSGGALYGTMHSFNGLPVAGSIRDLIFRVNTNGSGFTTLKRFDNISGDASQPSPLLLTNGMLYGTTALGGISNAGIIFAINTNGGGYTNLRSFNGTNEGRAAGRLLFSGNNLYGGTAYGGGFSRESVFRMNTNGTGFTLLRNLGDTYAPDVLAGNVMYGIGYDTNDGSQVIWKMNLDGSGRSVVKDFSSDGSEGEGASGLTLVGNTLYGSCNYGGALGNGNIFKVNTDGSSFSVLQSFSSDPPRLYGGYRLAFSGNTLYGIVPSNTNAYNLTVYKINLDGTGFGIVARPSDPRLGNSFAYPSGLIASRSTLYGASQGFPGDGAIFQINTNGSNFAVIHAFGPAPDGSRPYGDLILSGTTLYGSTYEGGEVGEGTIFRIDLRPRLSIVQTTSNLTLSWPSFAATYTLEQNTDLNTTNWSPVGVASVNDGTNRTVLLPLTNSVGTYRLRE